MVGERKKAQNVVNYFRNILSLFSFTFMILKGAIFH